jgi:hypothetical protein
MLSLDCAKAVIDSARQHIAINLQIVRFIGFWILLILELRGKYECA